MRLVRQERLLSSWRPVAGGLTLPASFLNPVRNKGKGKRGEDGFIVSRLLCASLWAMLHGLIWIDAFAFVLMTFTCYVFDLLNGVSGQRPDRRVQGEGHSLSGDTRGVAPCPGPRQSPQLQERSV